MIRAARIAIVAMFILSGVMALGCGGPEAPVRDAVPAADTATVALHIEGMT